MTVENCILRYEKYVAKGMTEAATEMKNHMLTARKFKDHPYLSTLNNPVKTVEVKKDGKKPKR